MKLKGRQNKGWGSKRDKIYDHQWFHNIKVWERRKSIDLWNGAKGCIQWMVQISSGKYLRFKIISQGNHAHSKYGNKFLKLVKVKRILNSLKKVVSRLMVIV